MNAGVLSIDPTFELTSKWAEHKIFGVEKDYRLARVSKISLFMHGAGDGNIIFGDGLENYPEKDIAPESFDILVANPPYAVKAFKPHLKLKDNSFSILDKISNDGSEIETLFVERMAQLIKPEGVAAVILPSSILNKENESFIAARETILKNFLIRAIAQLGSKTFGATGTSTVILFLERYNEPPKRLNLVKDSIDSIFNLNNLSDWEDHDILCNYLAKINVEISVYNSFIKRELNFVNWASNQYFKMYYEAFISSPEYLAKTKQKSFSKLSDEEKSDWLNSHFYDYVYSCEKEKLTYFALVYRQTTLVISAPDDNKAQERFLGYKWSNRKGQEGIQIITPGGMLYSDNDRYAEDKISGLIRNSFLGKQYAIPGLDDYSYYLNLQDMIEFKTLLFNKTIKITKNRMLKTTPGLINYSLSDKIFDISIGDRVVSDEVEANGTIPIISANVFEEFGRINKQNITDFSRPSIIWGIDGDWMVNLIPAGSKFYPTDHCGYMRINSNDILPKYMAIALEVEGRFEKFSRSNRASRQRIQNLIIQIPSDISVQQAIVDEITAIENKIKENENAIQQLTSSIETEYNKICNNDLISEIEIGTIAPFETEKVSIDSFPAANYITTDNMLQQKRGVIPYKEGTDKIKNVTKYSKGDILVSNIRPYLKKIWLADKDAGCSPDVLVFHITDTAKMLPEYVYYSLYQDAFFAYAMESKTGMKMPRGDKKQIPHFKIKNADLPTQTAFVEFVKEIDKKRDILKKKNLELFSEKAKLIAKYFE